jgi:catechol 2,3-dioxygenase-like lactoylglutathione lyase family enzyme
MATHFTHVTFTVSNFERSIAFYREVCELDVVRDRHAEGGSTVWLGPRDADKSNPPFVFVLEEGEVTDRLDHLAFQCDTREELEAKAALGQALNALHRKPRDVGGSVGYYTMLRDPDGHIVEFTHGQPIRGLH